MNFSQFRGQCNLSLLFRDIKSFSVNCSDLAKEFWLYIFGNGQKSDDLYTPKLLVHNLQNLHEAQI